MKVDFSRMQELIQQPQESLSVELKAWIDPNCPDGIAKIVKTALAMRNHGGGYIVIGFNNDTLEPILDNIPGNVREIFHIDKIQGMIAKYSSEPFEITVEFPQRNGQDFPVIIIPTGIKTPVAAKRDLPSNNEGKLLIRAHTVYVRSLSSNNTPSTTQAQSKDWSKLIEICFDNREADIGRFIRRHLGAIGTEQLNSLAAVLAGSFKPETSTEDSLKEYFEESEQHYEQALTKRNFTLPEHGLPEHGIWEVGLILIGQVPDHAANQEFLNLLSSSNPNYTGWPVWLDGRRLGEDNRPYPLNEVWEALLISLSSRWPDRDFIEFMRFDPKGKFFLMRALEDDMASRTRPDTSPQPLTTLDCGLAIIQTAEAIAVGIEFAKSMGCLPEETTLAFAFKWTKLAERRLSSRTNLLQWIPGVLAHQNEVITFVNVPLDIPLSALSQYVNQVVKPLFEVFEGFNLSKDVVEDMTRNLIERKL
jgi:hypothetical protein